MSGSNQPEVDFAASGPGLERNALPLLAGNVNVAA